MCVQRLHTYGGQTGRRWNQGVNLSLQTGGTPAAAVAVVHVDLSFHLNVVHQSEWHLSVAQKIRLSSQTALEKVQVRGTCSCYAPANESLARSQDSPLWYLRRDRSSERLRNRSCRPLKANLGAPLRRLKDRHQTWHHRISSCPASLLIQTVAPNL